LGLPKKEEGRGTEGERRESVRETEKESREPKTSERKREKTRENRKNPATRREEKQKRCPEHVIIFDFVPSSRYVFLILVHADILLHFLLFK
jgi:hypothetical protein